MKDSYYKEMRSMDALEEANPKLPEDGYDSECQGCTGISCSSCIVYLNSDLREWERIKGRCSIK